MGWNIGYDNNWKRHIGYGVPAECDLPSCSEEIDRGLAYVCGSDPYGGEYGCGLYFCPEHMDSRKPRYSDRYVQLCPRCFRYRPPFSAKPDIEEWVRHKLTDESWAEWRKRNPEWVAENAERLSAVSSDNINVGAPGGKRRLSSPAAAALSPGSTAWPGC
jgi:hypothetical protein